MISSIFIITAISKMAFDYGATVKNSTKRFGPNLDMTVGFWVLSSLMHAFAIDQLYSWVLGFRKSSALRGLLICRTLSTPVMTLGYCD